MHKTLRIPHCLPTAYPPPTHRRVPPPSSPGVNEHRDGDANLVSTVVHATMPDGDVGFSGGGELTIATAKGLPQAPITHSNETVGSVVYLAPKVYHDASPIKVGGRRLVFCMFYAAEPGTDLTSSRSSWTRYARPTC